MRTLFVALTLTLAASGCVSPDTRDESVESSDVQVTPSTSFVLTAGSPESSLGVSVGTGPVTHCAEFDTCQFSFAAGTVVTIRVLPTMNLADCARFSHWTGACSGTTSPCNVTMNSNLSVSSVWVPIPNCVPK